MTRVTPRIFISHALLNGQKHSANLAKLQLQASTGLRVHRPSDDPIATGAILSQQAASSRLDGQLVNVREARSTLNLSVTQLLEVKQIFTRAHEIAMEGNQSTETNVLASEVDGLIDRLLDIANTQHEGRYLFSGTAANVPAFARVSNGTASGGTQVVYQGSPENSVIATGPDRGVEVFFSGATIFQQRSRSAPVYIGNTGATAGAGTDNAVGQAELRVRHVATTFAGASGVLAGTSSANGDTIIGPAGANTLTINDTSGTGASGTVSLNGGPPVAFTNGMTDLQVIGPNGEIVHVNTSAITAGFNGTVNITATGAMSVDGGVTEVPIDFSANQIVSHTNGTVTNVNSTNIRRAGVEHIEYSGTADAFQVLAELRDDLLNSRNLSDADFHESMSRRIADAQRMLDGVLNIVGEQSVELENLDALERRSQDIQVEIQSRISELQAADMVDVAISLQAEQNLLQFTYATAGIFFQQSLLDFLG